MAKNCFEALYLLKKTGIYLEMQSLSVTFEKNTNKYELTTVGNC